MRHTLLLLAIISLSLSAFACGGTEGTQAAQVCAQVACPAGPAAVMAAGLAAFVVYAQTNLDEMVEFAQWVTTDVVEPLTGINKEMLGG